MIGVPVLVMLAVVALALAFTVRHRRQTGDTGPRIVVFLLGGAITQLTIYLYAALESFDPSVNLPSMLLGGIIWLLTYEVVVRARFRIEAKTLPLYIAAAWFLQGLASIALLLALQVASGVEVESAISYYSTLSSWLPSLTSTFTYVNLAGTALLFIVVHRLATRGDTSGLAETGAGPAIVYGGMEMSPSKSEATRLLAASAVLNGSTFRRQVLEHLRDPNRAVSPELGIDVRLVAQICTAAEHRERLYEWGFVAVLPAWLILLAAGGGVATVLAIALTAILYFRREHQRRYSLAAHFARGAFDPEEVSRRFDVALDPEISSALGTVEQNLIVYRDFTPFIGTGVDMGGWSFVVNLEKPAEGPVPLAPLPFELDELYQHIDTSLHSTSVEGFAASDAFFVSGSGIQKDREILPDAYGRPIERLSPVASLRYRNNSDPRVRHYRWFRIHDWSNELIVSHFFRCARRGRTMFIEVNRYLLAPIADRYRKVDSLPAPHFRHLTLLGLVSIVAGPLAVIGAAFSLLARLTLAVERVFGTRKRHRRREIDDNPLFNYGAATPLRQAFSSDRFLHYFQKIDGDCYNKVFEREVLDAICSFLEAHHIDTSDLRERQNVIMNSGIIVQGGDVRAESLAVGSGATASKTTTNPLMQRIRQEKKA